MLYRDRPIMDTLAILIYHNLFGRFPGVQVMSAADLAHAKHLLVAADVNAVPPLGIEGLDLHANGAPLGERGALGVGALAIGNVTIRQEFGINATAAV